MTCADRPAGRTGHHRCPTLPRREDAMRTTGHQVRRGLVALTVASLAVACASTTTATAPGTTGSADPATVGTASVGTATIGTATLAPGGTGAAAPVGPVP